MNLSDKTTEPRRQVARSRQPRKKTGTTQAGSTQRQPRKKAAQEGCKEHSLRRARALTSANNPLFVTIHVQNARTANNPTRESLLVYRWLHYGYPHKSQVQYFNFSQALAMEQRRRSSANDAGKRV